MSYLTDDPWPLVIVLLGAAAVSLFIIPGRGKPVALICLVAAGLVWFVEGTLISPAERIEIQANAILEDFKHRDIDSIRSRISKDSPELIETAERGLEFVDLESDFEVRSVDVTLHSESTATARIRANGTGKLRSNGFLQRAPTFWSTEWTKQNGDWLLSSATRLDLMSGEPKATFDRN